MSFARAVAFVLDPRNDGQPYHVTPGDPGGATAYGWALKENPDLTDADLRAMTPTIAAERYYARFWPAIKGDQLPENLHLPMLDTAVVEGPRTAIKCLQRALGLVDDGVIGPVTLRTAHALAGNGLLEKFGAERIVEMSNCQNWPHDRRGWSRRVIASCVENLS